MSQFVTLVVTQVRSQLGVLLGIIICIEVAVLSRGVPSGEFYWIPPADQETRELSARVLKVISAGYLPVLIDVLWMRSLQDDRLHAVQTGKHPPVYYTIRNILKLDPANYLAYYYGANQVSIVRKDHLGAIDILGEADRFRFDSENGLKSFAEEFRSHFWFSEWRLPMTAAYIYWFELSDFAKASEKFLDASQFEQAPHFLKSLGPKLKDPKNIFSFGFDFIKVLIDGAEYDWEKEKYSALQRDLQVTHFLFQVNELFQSFREKTKSRGRASEAEFEKFLVAMRKVNRDPWGGKLSVDSRGKIVTTTPRENRFGLEY